MLSSELDIYSRWFPPKSLCCFSETRKPPFPVSLHQNFYQRARKYFIDAPWHSSRTFGATQEQKAIPAAAVRGKLIGRSGNFAAQSDPPDFSCNLFVLATRPNWLEWCRISMSAHSWPHTTTQGVSTHLTARCLSFLGQKLSYCEQRSACAQTGWAFIWFCASLEQSALRSFGFASQTWLSQSLVLLKDNSELKEIQGLFSCCISCDTFSVYSSFLGKRPQIRTGSCSSIEPKFPHQLAHNSKTSYFLVLARFIPNGMLWRQPSFYVIELFLIVYSKFFLGIKKL